MNATPRRLAPMLAAACVGASLVLVTQYAATRWAGGKSAVAPADILATVDGQPITVEAFQREMVSRGGASIGVFAEPERRRALLEEMIRFQVLLASAKQAGFEHDPDVQAEAEHYLAGKFRAERIDSQLDVVTASEEEVERYFQEHIGEFTIPESAHAAVLHFAWTSTTPEAARRAITERAEAVRAEALTQTDRTFGALALKSDDQATRYLGGDIGWLPRGQKDSRWESAVIETIFALAKAGELAPPLTTDKGIYLVKLIEAKKPAETRPLDEVRSDIMHQLVNEKREQLSKQLYAEAQQRLHVEVNEARLRSLEVPQSTVAQEKDQQPPALPPG